MTDIHPFSQINFDKSNSWVIEASAGTGKTWTVERLYIKAILQNIQYKRYTNLSINNILVVTFTKDATRELKSRIRCQIKDTIHQIIKINNQKIKTYDDVYTEFLVKRYIEEECDFHKDVSCLNLCLQGFDNAAIHTIHGFCNQILKDYPFECGVDPDYKILNSNKSIIDNLIRKFVWSLFSNTKYLKYIKQIESNIMKIFAVFDSSKSDYNQDDIVSRIQKSIPPDLIIFKDGRYQIKYPYSSQDIDDLMSDLISEVEAGKVVATKLKFISACFDYIINHYDNVVKLSNSLTNDDLIQIVASNIKNISHQIYEEYPIAFIDEFQDTDQLQWTIFSAIYNKRGNLVVVGDPKQAIYKFRGADINTYITARNQINKVCQLTDNYRSAEPIMQFVNQLFKLENQNSSLEDSFLGRKIDYIQINPRGKPNLELPTAAQIENYLSHNRVNAKRKYYDESVQIVAVCGANKKARERALLEHMTSEIIGLLAVNPSLLSKITIVVSKNYQINEIIQYLRKFNLSVAKSKSGSIYATSTATEIYNILSAINDLTNSRKLIKALTSKIFNLPLYELKNENSIKELVKTWFIKYYELWQNKGITDVFYTMLNDVFAYHDNDAKIIMPRELANFWQLAELISREKMTNNEELLYWLKKKIDDALEQKYDVYENSEELVRLDNDGDHINIATIHASKGLEYDILFCPYFSNSMTKLKNLPIFTTLNSKATIISQTDDNEVSKEYIKESNQELQRLNYVALTRAKSRIYVYLKEVNRNKDGSYRANSVHESISELFGLNIRNHQLTSHPIANYEDLFKNQPLKSSSPLATINGVIVYQTSNILINEYKELNLRYNLRQDNCITTININLTNNKSLLPLYYKQSYTELTKQSLHVVSELADKDIDNVDNNSYPDIVYKYKLLNDDILKGAEFGVLFHTLCEEYPFDLQRLQQITSRYRISDSALLDELNSMLHEVFNYPLFNDVSLNKLKHKIHELDFNLTVKRNIDIKTQLSALINQYYGTEHSFAKYIKTLDNINNGFLVGFIDLIFEYDGKYYVLDYKTNCLNNYSYTVYNQNTAILDSMAAHHYYLQYLLYLVALKRYLEYRLKISDATHLIGGAIYYYIRGALTISNKPFDGIYIDKDCQELVAQIDKLFKSE